MPTSDQSEKILRTFVSTKSTPLILLSVDNRRSENVSSALRFKLTEPGNNGARTMF